MFGWRSRLYRFELKVPTPRCSEPANAAEATNAKRNNEREKFYIAIRAADQQNHSPPAAGK